jgi:UDP-3-O-[3-hydroxymyristoyl] glucosamine N-acyltransferase
MSPPRKPGIPASVATTALVSNAPDGSTIGHFALVYDAARLGRRVHVHAF